jgi:hypothetical protein
MLSGDLEGSPRRSPLYCPTPKGQEVDCRGLSRVRVGQAYYYIILYFPLRSSHVEK